MKKLIIAAASLLLVACHAKNEFSKEQAKILIEQDLHSRNPVTVPINSSGEESLAYLKDTKLVADGFIIFVDKPGLMEPRVSYSEQARSFLLQPKQKPSSAAEEKFVSTFKSSDMVLTEVKEVKLTDDGNQAAVQYTYSWGNTTPFFELQRNKEVQTAKAYFDRSADGQWTMVTKPSTAQKQLVF